MVSLVSLLSDEGGREWGREDKGRINREKRSRESKDRWKEVSRDRKMTGEKNETTEGDETGREARIEGWRQELRGK